MTTSPAHLSNRRTALAAALLCAGLCASTAARAADVAYVASLLGGADLEGEKGQSSELSFLDLLPDGSRIKLDKGAEMRVCHHASGQITSAVGPAVIRVGVQELFADSGPPPVRSGERCSAPVISRVQGGSAFRSLASSAAVAVSPRSWLRIAPAGRLIVRRAVLMAPDERSKVAEFRTISISPVFLTPGQTYPLQIEMTDGRKFTVRLAPSEAVEADVAVISITP